MGQTDLVLDLLHGTFGADLVGAYLHGSAVLGGLRPHSDVDVLAVVRRPAAPAERRALVAGLLPVSGGGARPVELTVVAETAVRPWRYPPVCEFQYGEWLRDEYERGMVPEPAPSPDLAPLITMALAGDAPLFGPPPSRVFAPVPHADVVRAVVGSVPELLGDLDGDARNVVLTLARVWATAATGEIMPKDAAAAWALPRLPAEHRPVLARARAVYLGEEDERWDDLRSRLRPHAEFVASEIDRMLHAPGARRP
ncbi:aminoglycoside adenylyltransferase family protein [Actinomadura sediminis]|uniref:Aminoglycoside adenylyltransferase family protein n=1 Tax=Actinomadura sediminis TaxID=1038904 RepID=A0ABW3EKT4_9ACTN